MIKTVLQILTILFEIIFNIIKFSILALITGVGKEDFEKMFAKLISDYGLDNENIIFEFKKYNSTKGNEC